MTINLPDAPVLSVVPDHASPQRLLPVITCLTVCKLTLMAVVGSVPPPDALERQQELARTTQEIERTIHLLEGQELTRYALTSRSAALGDRVAVDAFDPVELDQLGRDGLRAATGAMFNFLSSIGEIANVVSLVDNGLAELPPPYRDYLQTRMQQLGLAAAPAMHA